MAKGVREREFPQNCRADAMNVYRTPADPGGFPFGYDWRATLTGLAFLVLFNIAATQYVALRFHYQLALGKPLLC